MELQFFLLNDLQIAPIIRILMIFPSILVRCNPGLIQIVINFFVLIDAHRVDGCETLRMFIFLKTLAHSLSGEHVRIMQETNMFASCKKQLSWFTMQALRRLEWSGPVAVLEMGDVLVCVGMCCVVGWVSVGVGALAVVWWWRSKKKNDVCNFKKMFRERIYPHYGLY